MVWASLSNAPATAAAVPPCASSRTTCHLSRSRGVGARHIRRRTSALSMRHRSSRTPVSIMPNSNPHSDFLILSDQLNYCLFYPTPLRVSFWLRFRMNPIKQNGRKVYPRACGPLVPVLGWHCWMEPVGSGIAWACCSARFCVERSRCRRRRLRARSAVFSAIEVPLDAGSVSGGVY